VKNSGWALIIIGILFCHLSISSSVSAQNDTLYFDLVYEGIFPENLWGDQIKAGKLVEGKPETLVTLDSAGFEIFQFTDSLWKRLDRLPFVQETANRMDRRSTWTIGDLDNDGIEEIVTWSGKTVLQFKARADSFITCTYDFPYVIQQGLIGDIDNDCRNDLVAFCLDENLYRYYEDRLFGGTFRLCVLELDAGDLNLTWTDDGNLGYIWSTIVPPDRLQLIAPFPDGNENKLLVSRSQSDMSPTTYDLLAWGGEVLERVQTFKIFNGCILGQDQWPEYPSKPKSRKSPVVAPLPGEWTGRANINDPSICGALQSITVAGRRAFLGMQIPPGTNNRVVLIPKGDYFTVHPLAAREDRWIPGMASLWMDLDGLGEGILALRYNLPGQSVTEMKWMYWFYRLH